MYQIRCSVEVFPLESCLTYGYFDQIDVLVLFFRDNLQINFAWCYTWWDQCQRHGRTSFVSLIIPHISDAQGWKLVSELHVWFVACRMENCSKFSHAIFWEPAYSHFTGMTSDLYWYTECECEINASNTRGQYIFLVVSF